MNERSYFIMMHSNFKCIEICHKNVEISILFLYIWMANGVLMRNFKNIKSSHFRFVCTERFFFKIIPRNCFIRWNDWYYPVGKIYSFSEYYHNYVIFQRQLYLYNCKNKKKKGGSHAVLILRIGNAGSDENCHFLVHK